MTITAVTSVESEFFHVVNWCYDVAGIGHLIRATFLPGRLQLRLTLKQGDGILERFAEKVADRALWNVQTAE